MPANVFEKIVTIVSKVVQILGFAMTVFFGSEETQDTEKSE